MGLGTIGAMPTIINKSGLYSLILKRRGPAAKLLKKRVTAAREGSLFVSRDQS